MISKQITFWVQERRNVHSRQGREWALNAQLVGHPFWTLKVWDSRPTEERVEEVKNIIQRAFDFYHKHLQIPPFELKETVVEVK